MALTAVSRIDASVLLAKVFTAKVIDKPAAPTAAVPMVVLRLSLLVAAIATPLIASVAPEPSVFITLMLWLPRALIEARLAVAFV